MAFLLLTSKSEHYIRDRVSLNLKEILGNKYLISREWGKNKSKIDIAVLRRGNSKKPVLMLEFKTNSVGSHIIGYRKEIENDIDKLRKIHAKHNRCYVIFTSLFLDKTISPDFADIVKYYKDINSFINGRGFEAKFKNLAERYEYMVQLWNNLSYKKKIASSDLPRVIYAGKFYKQNTVKLLAWVIQLTH